MTFSRNALLGAASVAALVIVPIAAQGTREVITLGGGGQDVRILTEQAAAAAAGARLQPMPLGNGVIVGQAIDGGSKQPVGGALVMLTLPGSQPVRALADAEGRFAFRELPAGRFNLSVTKAGFVEGAYGRLRPSGPTRALVLDENGREASVSIPLWRFAAITGTLADEHGEPLIGATVRALRKAIVAGVPKFTVAATDQTDDRGIFRISSLEPGEYIVAVPMTQNAGLETFALGGGMVFEAVASTRAELPVMMVSEMAGAMPPGLSEDGRPLAYPTQFYPAAVSSTRATVIAVASGEERAGVDFQLRPARAQRISGHVTGPDGPAQHVSLSLVPADADALATAIETATTISDANGTFTFPAVPAGQYSIKVLRAPQTAMRGVPDEMMVQTGGAVMVTRTVTIGGPGGGVAPPPPTDPTLWADVPVTVGSTDIVDLGVALRPGPRVRGEVQFNGAAQRPTPDRLPAIMVMLEPADGRTGLPLLRGRVENTGSFSTASVPPGKYVLRVAGVPQGWTFRGAIAGGRDIADMPIDIEGSDIGGVMLTFTDRPSEISGSVTAAAGGADDSATVIVFPTDREGWTHYGMSPRRLRNVRVDKTGAFTISNLPPGDYYVAAVREASAADWQSPRFLEALAPQAQRVQLGDGQKASQSLKVVK
jgi:hypothetical protein